MHRILSFSRPKIALLVTGTLLVGLVVIIQTKLAEGSPAMLAFAVTADLLITIPLIWFLCIRKTAFPNISTVAVLVLGLLTGTLLIPAAHQGYLDLFKIWALPVIELLVLTFVILKVRNAIKKYRHHQLSTQDFFTTLKRTCSEILPGRLAIFFATEIAVIYYGFLHWKSLPQESHTYFYHQRSGTQALLGAIIGILALETFALHMLLAHWHGTIAWIVTGLSIYTTVQVFGFARSLSKRPVLLTADKLILRYGIMSETEIPLEKIASIELSRSLLPADPMARKLSPLGQLVSHNVILHLSSEQDLHGLYGKRKTFTTLALHLDQPAEFKTYLGEALAKRERHLPGQKL